MKRRRGLTWVRMKENWMMTGRMKVRKSMS